MAADVLTSSKTIAQAICEGGWATKTEEPEDEDKKAGSDEDLDENTAENKMVESILSKSNVSLFQKYSIVLNFYCPPRGKY